MVGLLTGYLKFEKIGWVFQESVWVPEICQKLWDTIEVFYEKTPWFKFNSEFECVLKERPDWFSLRMIQGKRLNSKQSVIFRTIYVLQLVSILFKTLQLPGYFHIERRRILTHFSKWRKIKGWFKFDIYCLSWISGIFRIFDPMELNLNLNNSDCRI